MARSRTMSHGPTRGKTRKRKMRKGSVEKKAKGKK